MSLVVYISRPLFTWVWLCFLKCPHRALFTCIWLSILVGPSLTEFGCVSYYFLFTWLCLFECFLVHEFGNVSEYASLYLSLVVYLTKLLFKFPVRNSQHPWSLIVIKKLFLNQFSAELQLLLIFNQWKFVQSQYLAELSFSTI